VGRLASSGIRLEDANVSREHAAFVRDGDGWAIRDLGSTNGTMLDGEPVTYRVLEDGDVVEIGVSRLIYHGPGR
jgi:pSer/pThr/pTyr-binding forkhead associated (FHA) protein